MSTRPPTPGPWRLTLVTNPDDCNLACPMCECGAARGARPAASAGAPRRMDPALAERVVREAAAAGVREVIPSTMGEPLLWAGLDRLVELCAELGLALNVTTNGTFPGRGAAAWAERLAPVAVDVKISWNAATALTAAALMPGLDLARAVEDVRAFVAVRDAGAAAGARRCRVSFQVTAQEGNVAELGAIVRLAAALGVERVKVNQLQVRSPTLADRSLRRSAAALARWNAAVEDMRAAADQARLPSGEAVLLENVTPLCGGGDGTPRTPRQRSGAASSGCPSAWPTTPESTPAAAGPCRFVGREAWVHFDGTFAPCPSPAAIRGELGAFGSVAASSFAAVWGGAALRALVAGWEEHPVCRSCPLRRPGGA